MVVVVAVVCVPVVVATVVTVVAAVCRTDDLVCLVVVYSAIVGFAFAVV